MKVLVPLATLEKAVYHDDLTIALQAVRGVLTWPDRESTSPRPPRADALDWEERLRYARYFTGVTADSLRDLTGDINPDVKGAARAHPLILAGDHSLRSEIIDALIDYISAYTSEALNWDTIGLMVFLQQLVETGNLNLLNAIVSSTTRVENEVILRLSHCCALHLTTSQALQILEKSPWKVREYVASQSDTPLELLIKLLRNFEDTEWTEGRVAWAAAKNPSLPQIELLRALEEAEIHLGAVERLVCSDDEQIVEAALNNLLTNHQWEYVGIPEDEDVDDHDTSVDWEVRLAFARTHGRVSVSDLQAMLEVEDDEDVLAALNAHPLIVSRSLNTPASVLSILAGEEDWEVRLGVAEHPRTTVEVLQRLLSDEDSDVCDAAHRRDSTIVTESQNADDQSIEKIIPVTPQNVNFAQSTNTLAAAVVVMNENGERFRLEMEIDLSKHLPRMVMASAPTPEHPVATDHTAERGDQVSEEAISVTAVRWRERELECDVEFVTTSPHPSRSTVRISLPEGRVLEPSQQHPSVSLTPAADGQAMNAILRFAPAEVADFWVACVSDDDEVAPLVYPRAHGGYVTPKSATTLLMFDVGGRYEQRWTLRLRLLGESALTSWDGRGTPPTDRHPVWEKNQVPMTWPAHLPQPGGEVQHVFDHVIRHQTIGLNDLHSWMDRQRYGRAIRREFTGFLDELSLRGWPVIVRNDSHQPPRLEANLELLRVFRQQKQGS